MGFRLNSQRMLTFCPKWERELEHSSFQHPEAQRHNKGAGIWLEFLEQRGFLRNVKPQWTMVPSDKDLENLVNFKEHKQIQNREKF